MTEKQSGQFAGDPNLGALIDQMNTIPEAEIGCHWPRALAGLVDIIETEFQRQGLDGQDARRLARSAVVAQAGYMGGRSWYLPTGDSLFAALRRHDIFSRWRSGARIETLRRQFRLSQTQIYAILREQRQLHTRRVQPPLPL